MEDSVDFMVIGAHADDAEISMGGTIAKMVSQGHRGILVDLCDASAATRGTQDERLLESKKAAAVLGVDRVQLGLADARLVCDQNSLGKVVECIRHWRPKTIFTHYADDRHPDHFVCCDIVRHAWYKSGLAALWPEWPSHRVARLFHFFGPVYAEPKFCVDISDFWDHKGQALRCYGSQFDPRIGVATPIASPEFMELIETRARHLGSLIRTRYAEGFWCRESAEVLDPLQLSTRVF